MGRQPRTKPCQLKTRTQSQLRRSLRLRRFLRPRRPSAESQANQQLPLRPTTKLTRPPLMGPMQAEQLSQFLRNISAPQENQEPEERVAKEKLPEQQLQEQLGQLGQLGQL